ncbi:MAG: translation initiation factor IF-2 [Candidatus Diapherotrites archaeon]|nr:translation initiation factor IF-2 [Candidatus Diapherotrites archaeon]
MIRQPIIVVMGHVDSGKTKFLDRIRGTSIQEKEAGGITQHIGATEVPIEAVKKMASTILEKYRFSLTLPGLLFIDTPGHEAFTNLRRRGGSIADLAVLMVDIQKGLQPQTIEALEILRSYHTPFLVTLNKIDSVHGWQTAPRSFTESMAQQDNDSLNQLDTKLYELVGQLATHGFTTERFDRVQDFTREIAIIPISAKNGEGIPEVLLFLAGLSQKFLEKNLSMEETAPGKGTVLEVKEETGFGKTVDVILYDGTLKVGDEIVLASLDGGSIKTKVRALLEPRPLDEITSPSKRFLQVTSVHAASGVKVMAPGLEHALAGSPLRVVSGGSEEKEVLEEVERVKIHSDRIGVILKADTLGSLEAMIKLFEQAKIPVKKADIGQITRRDIMECEAVAHEDRYKGVLFGFNSHYAAGAQEEAEKKGVPIISGNVIYHLLEEYQKWAAQEKEKEKKELLEQTVYPARVSVLPGCIFRKSKPAVVGVHVQVGRLRPGIQLMKKGNVIGTLRQIQRQNETVPEAVSGEQVAISVEKAEAGKDILEGDELFSYIPLRQFARLQEARNTFNSAEQELLEEIKNIELTKMTMEETA